MQKSQMEAERVDSFITALFSLVEHCNYGTLQEEILRDHIVLGLRDK